MDSSILADDTASFPTQELLTNTPPPSCDQCVNWRNIRTVAGKQLPGFCEVRAAADLFQMPRTYAAKCHLFLQEVPL
jgi:hypothetical protein